MTEFAANFTAIDFETANHRRDSACQLAAVRIRAGQITESAKWMIRPEPFFFTRGNIQIHGITPDQVADEPNFGDQWQTIAETLGDDCLVAHNASFDIGVLLACLKKHRQAVPAMQFTCTRAIARRTWPNRPRYGLKALADWLGIRFQHHDALEDSIACAKVLLAAGIDKQAGTLPALENRLRLSRGTADEFGYRGPTRKARPRRSGRQSTRRPALNEPPLPSPFDPLQCVHELPPPYLDQAATEPVIDLQRLLVRADFIRPLAGKYVVFAGKLKTMTNEHAELLTSRSGGSCQQVVTCDTSYLVIGNSESRDDLNEQQQKAEEFRSDGRPIQILSEEDFLGLVTARSLPKASS